jgi:hypothetical protein
MADCSHFGGRDFFTVGSAGLPRELDFMIQLFALLVLIQIFKRPSSFQLFANS